MNKAKCVDEFVSDEVALTAAILAPTKLSPGLLEELPAILNLKPTPSPPAWSIELESSLEDIVNG